MKAKGTFKFQLRQTVYWIREKEIRDRNKKVATALIIESGSIMSRCSGGGNLPLYHIETDNDDQYTISENKLFATEQAAIDAAIGIQHGRQG